MSEEVNAVQDGVPVAPQPQNEDNRPGAYVGSVTGGQSVTNRPMTHGERAVGLAFNPGGNEMVNNVKELYAQIIDILHGLKTSHEMHISPERARHLSIAITDAETAQMRAVKGITWQD